MTQNLSNLRLSGFTLNRIKHSLRESSEYISLKYTSSVTIVIRFSPSLKGNPLLKLRGNPPIKTKMLIKKGTPIFNLLVCFCSCDQKSFCNNIYPCCTFPQFSLSLSMLFQLPHNKCNGVVR